MLLFGKVSGNLPDYEKSQPESNCDSIPHLLSNSQFQTDEVYKIENIIYSKHLRQAPLQGKVVRTGQTRERPYHKTQGQRTEKKQARMDTLNPQNVMINAARRIVPRIHPLALVIVLVKLYLPDVFRRNLADLQIDQEEAARKEVVENEIAMIDLLTSTIRNQPLVEQCRNLPLEIAYTPTRLRAFPEIELSCPFILDTRQRTIVRPAQLVTQCVTNWKSEKYKPHVLEVGRSVTRAELRRQLERKAPDESIPVLRTFRPALFLDNLTTDIPIGENHLLVGDSVNLCPCLRD